MLRYLSHRMACFGWKNNHRSALHVAANLISVWDSHVPGSNVDSARFRYRAFCHVVSTAGLRLASPCSTDNQLDNVHTHRAWWICESITHRCQKETADRAVINVGQDTLQGVDGDGYSMQFFMDMGSPAPRVLRSLPLHTTVLSWNGACRGLVYYQKR